MLFVDSIIWSGSHCDNQFGSVLAMYNVFFDSHRRVRWLQLGCMINRPSRVCVRQALHHSMTITGHLSSVRQTDRQTYRNIAFFQPKLLYESNLLYEQDTSHSDNDVSIDCKEQVNQYY